MIRRHLWPEFCENAVFLQQWTDSNVMRQFFMWFSKFMPQNYGHSFLFRANIKEKHMFSSAPGNDQWIMHGSLFPMENKWAILSVDAHLHIYLCNIYYVWESAYITHDMIQTAWIF